MDCPREDLENPGLTTTYGPNVPFRQVRVRGDFRTGRHRQSRGLEARDLLQLRYRRAGIDFAPRRTKAQELAGRKNQGRSSAGEPARDGRRNIVRRDVHFDIRRQLLDLSGNGLKICNILIPRRMDKDEIAFNCHLAISIKRRFEM